MMLKSVLVLAFLLASASAMPYGLGMMGGYGGMYSPLLTGMINPLTWGGGLGMYGLGALGYGGLSMGGLGMGAYGMGGYGLGGYGLGGLGIGGGLGLGAFGLGGLGMGGLSYYKKK